MNVFESLNEALKQGYHVYARVPEGYLVRTRVRDRWALALVSLRRASLGVDTSSLVFPESAGRLDGR